MVRGNLRYQWAGLILRGKQKTALMDGFICAVESG